MISEAHRRLRDATQADHRRLEARMDILERIATRDGRRELVQRFHRLHVEAEAALEPWLANLPELEFEARRRSVQLDLDLAAVGIRAGDGTDADVDVAGIEEALGRMYVLEGSTLGGRVIRRAVESRGGDMTGLSFLDPYGEHVGERWRAFLAVVDRRAHTADDIQAMIGGAVAGFRRAELHLCGEAEHV